MTPYRVKKGAIAPFTALLLAATTGCAMDAPALNLPAPGSYTLYKIQRAPETSLLDRQGKSVPFSSYTQGAVTALGFFYSHCADPFGCPVAWSTFQEAREKAEADPLLKDRLRLVFVSLDPTRDTPAVMRMLEKEKKNGAVPWSFLTGANEKEMASLLRAMGQDVSYDVDTAGKPTGGINHMLKVFLIDPQGWVREIYSTAFLTPQALLNDARTLAIQFPDARNATGSR